MAPMEIVYECVEPPRKRPTAPAFLIALAIVLVGLATLLLDYMTKK